MSQMTSSTEQLAPALDVDARLAGIERGLTLLLNVTPVNAAKAWADFERSDFGTVPILRLRPAGIRTAGPRGAAATVGASTLAGCAGGW